MKPLARIMLEFRLGKPPAKRLHGLRSFIANILYISWNKRFSQYPTNISITCNHRSLLFSVYCHHLPAHDYIKKAEYIVILVISNPELGQKYITAKPERITCFSISIYINFFLSGIYANLSFLHFPKHQSWKMSTYHESSLSQAIL